MSCATVAVGNVQPHSVGDIFPYRIVIRCDSKVGEIWAENSEIGYESHHYFYGGHGEGTFKEAHRAAEQDALWDKHTREVMADDAKAKADAIAAVVVPPLVFTV